MNDTTKCKSCDKKFPHLHTFKYDNSMVCRNCLGTLFNERRNTVSTGIFERRLASIKRLKD